MKISEKYVCILGNNNLLTYKLAHSLVNCGFHVDVFTHSKDMLFTHGSISSFTLQNKVKLEKCLKESNYIINLLLAPTPDNYANWQHNLNLSQYAIGTASLHPIFINTLPLFLSHNFSTMAKEFNSLNYNITKNLKRYNNLYLGHIMSNDDSLLSDLTLLSKKYHYGLKESDHFSIIDEDDAIVAIIAIINSNYMGKIFELAFDKQFSIGDIQKSLNSHYNHVNVKIKSVNYLRIFNLVLKLNLRFLNNNYLHLLKYSKKISTNCITLADLNITPSNLNIIINKYCFRS